MQSREPRESCTGKLLLSVPQMLDPNFMHTVVLVCEHTREGAYGFVVNQRADYTMEQLVPDHPELSSLELPVFSGGPVPAAALQFVHRVPATIPGGYELGAGLYLGGDVSALAAFAGEHGARAASDVRLFLGYSGWGEGQLDNELAVGSWVTAEADPELVFATEASEAVWRRAMRGLGDDGEGLSHLPPDVTWN